MHRPLTLTTLVLSLFLAGCNDDARPDGFPESRVYDGNYGATYKRPAVATEQREKSYWAQDIADGYASPRESDAPARLVAASLSGGCTLPKPSDGAEVVYVEIYAGYDDAPLFFVKHDDIKEVRRYIEATHSRPDLERMVKVNAAKQVDVFVTETEKPVYLVLAAYDQTIWSLQIADGVELDGIAVLGYEPQALAHAPANVRVAYAVYDKSPQQRCMAMPQRPVNGTWKALEKAQKQRSESGFKRTINEARENRSRFWNWLSTRVGRPDRSIDAYLTSHVLVGPQPSARMQYRPLAGAEMGFTDNAVPIWGDAGDAEDRIYELAEGRQ